MYQKIGKRVLDITCASIAVAVFAVPMVLIALWVKLDSPGPALFIFPRSGKNRKPFNIYKFRTMRTNAPKDAPTNAFKDAGSFITRSGKIMRKLSLDELPQLFNVLKGNMSIVGPRPVVLKEVELLDIRDKVGANALKPGITGLAQISGRDELTPNEKAVIDGIYGQRLSFFFDLKCIFLTVWTVVSLEGQREGHERSFSEVIDEVVHGEHLVVDEAN